MSTRWYPIYQRGNPQLRIFLPNFWLKLIKSPREQPANIVEFACPVEMTRFDIQSYLEKIYGIPVVAVRTKVVLGKIGRDRGRGYITKGDDYKVAYVTMPKDEKFVYPDIFEKSEEKKEEEENKMVEDSKKGFREYLHNNRERNGVPSWYSF